MENKVYMNIAAEELGRDNVGTPVNPQNLVHTLGALDCCTTTSERRKKKNFLGYFFFLPALQCPQSFGAGRAKTCSFVQPDLFSFAVDFCFPPSSQIWRFWIWCYITNKSIGNYILKVTLLTTFPRGA